MIPRFGSPPRKGQRYTLRTGVYCILPRDGQLLLTHQEEPEPEFQLPGGGVDPGEHLVPALGREVLEETGWTIGPVRRLGAYRRFTYMPEYDLWAEKLCHIYVARPARRISEPLEAGHTAIWMAPDLALQAIASPGDRELLHSWLIS